jgi:diadenosine tetraphosphate (Ap4A) HIT family hydrolase
MKPECCICSEINYGIIDNKFVDYSSVKERILCRSDNFITIPSVSPLSVDHLLIFPEYHISSLAQLPHNLLPEFIDFVNSINQILSNKHTSIIMFEHGVGKGQQGGCGIDHAHLHILPCSSDLYNNTIIELTNSYNKPLFTNLKDLIKISNISNYIIIGNSINNMNIYNSTYFESQTVRKILCKFLNIEDWDWKKLTNKSNFEQTIHDWHYL